MVEVGNVIMLSDKFLNFERKMGEALELMRNPDAEPEILARWNSVIDSYMKRVPDGMSPAAHMASAIIAADLLIASIADRRPAKRNTKSRCSIPEDRIPRWNLVNGQYVPANAAAHEAAARTTAQDAEQSAPKEGMIGASGSPTADTSA